jgi:type I restriction enzyme M protein
MMDILRGSVDIDDARSFLLGLLLLKRFSDRFDEECEALHEEGFDSEDPDEHQFFVPPQARWRKLCLLSRDLGEALNHAASALENANPSVQGVLAGIDFNDGRKLGDARQRDSILGNLIFRLSQVDLKNTSLSEPDLLGSAFGFLTERFAGSREAGEFHTPGQVARLMVEILQPQEGMRICDPTCGSGGMLIQCAQYVQRKGGDPRNLGLYGQEKNLTVWSLCKMNLLLHGFQDARIERGDTIREPKLLADDRLMLFDIVLSNPPVSLPNWGREAAEYDHFRRFRFGVPPDGRGDFAFLQHMLATLQPRGRMAALVPPGVLFRRDREGGIRKDLLEHDLIEAVIELPSGSLYNTAVAPVILLLSRAKSAERREKVLFVDASKRSNARPGTPGLDAADIQQIVSAVQGFREIDQFSKVAALVEIADQGHSLLGQNYFARNKAAQSGERLDQIADILAGTRRSAMTGRKMPIVQGRDLGVRRLAKEDLACAPASDDPLRTVLVEPGDILLQRIGQNPKAMLAGEDLAGALVGDTVYVIRLHDKYRPQRAYLVSFLSSPAGRERLMHSSRQAVIPTLSLRTLRAFRVPLLQPSALELFDRVHAVEEDLFERVQKTLRMRSRLFENQEPQSFEAEIRRLSLEASLLRDSLAQSEDLNFKIRNFYPHMISYGYRCLDSVYDPRSLYRDQLGVLEVLLTVLGSIGLALATYIAGRPADLESRGLGRKDILNLWRSGTLGTWKDCCRRVSNFLHGRSTPAAASFASAWPTKLEPVFDKLIERRNADAHRRGPQTKADFRSAVKDVGSLLREALGNTLFLSQHPIRLVESHSAIWNDTDLLHRTLIYRGDHPGLGREEVKFNRALPEGHLYLELEPQIWVPLYPLLSVAELDSRRCTYAIDRFDEAKQAITLKGLEFRQPPDPEHSSQVGKDISIWLDRIFAGTP